MNKWEKEVLIDYLKKKDYTNEEINCLLEFDKFFDDSYYYKTSFYAYINGEFDLVFYLSFKDKHFYISLRDDYKKEIVIVDDYLDNMDIANVKFINKRLQNIYKNLSEIK